MSVDWPKSDRSVVWTSLFYWLGAADIWDFIVSKDPLPDWKGQLRGGRFSGWKITKSLLDRICFVLFNHYDHGFKIVGRSFNPDTLQAVAEEVSGKYDLPLQIQDTGNPFGDP